MAAAEERIDLVVAAKDAASGPMTNVRKSIEGVTGATVQAAAATRTFTQRINEMRGSISSIRNVGAATFAAVSLGLGAAVKSASDLNESVNAVNVTFGKASEGILALSRESAKAVGLSSADFNALAVQFSNFAVTVAGKGGDVSKTMGDLTTRVADFASVMNVYVKEAAVLFQSGLAGETEPLRRYGIDLSAATVQSFALAAGIVKAGQEMTQQQKVLATYRLLMAQTAKVQGDFANTADGLENRQRVLKAEMVDLSAKVGSMFVPVMERALGSVRPMVEATSEWASENPRLVVTIVSATLALSALVVVLAQLALALPMIIAGAKALGAGLVFLAANPIGQSIVAVAALTAAIYGLYQAYKIWREAVTQETVTDARLGANLSEVAKRYNDAQEKLGHSTRMTAEDIANLDAATRRSLIVKYGKGASAAVQELEDATAGMGKATAGAGGDVDLLKQMMEGMGTTAKATTSSVKTLLTQFDALMKKREDLRKQAADEAKSAALAGLDARQRAAALYVEQEKKVLDLQQQIDEEMRKPYLERDQESLGRLAGDKLRAQQALEREGIAAASLPSEVAEARRRSRLTDFERSMEDLRMSETQRNVDYAGRQAEISREAGETRTQIINFNFNGDVNDKDALKKEVVEMINRQSALIAAGA